MNEKQYMELAMEEAKKAFKEGEIPVGAVIVCNGEVIAKAHNRKEKTRNPMTHAEILVINDASKKIGDWRLNECLLFVNLEPCLMCMGLIIETRIKTVYCSTKNDKHKDILENIIKTNNLDFRYGLLNEESTELLKSFFKDKRNK